MYGYIWFFTIVVAVAAVILAIRHHRLMLRKSSIQYNNALGDLIEQNCKSLINALSGSRTAVEQYAVEENIYRQMRFIERAVEFLDSIPGRSSFRNRPAKERNPKLRALTNLRHRFLAARDDLAHYLREAHQHRFTSYQGA